MTDRAEEFVAALADFIDVQVERHVPPDEPQFATPVSVEFAARERLLAAVRALDGRTVDAAAGVFEGGPESTGWLRQQREADDE